MDISNIYDAKEVLKDVISKTPLVHADKLHENLWIKAENLQMCITDRAENRPTGCGFYEGMPSFHGHLYGVNGAGVTQERCV